MLGHAAAGDRGLDARNDTADLVLPAAAGAESLLEQERLGDQFIVFGLSSDSGMQCGQQSGGENAAGAQPRALGHAALGGNDQAAAKASEHGGQRFTVSRRIARQAERDLVQGERIPDADLLRQLVGVADFDVLAEIVRLQNEYWLPDGADHRPHGVLTVEFDGDVHHMAAAFVAIRRRVAPSAREIQTHRGGGFDAHSGTDSCVARIGNPDAGATQFTGFGDPGERGAGDGISMLSQR